MKRYKRVMFGTKSHAGGFEYKINEINETNHWNPKATTPEEMGGFNFSTEDKILRWLLRGDTIYDVEIPEGTEVIECESKNTPHGVFRSNKIILRNPRKLDDNLVMDLYLKSDLPENTYFQCLTFLSLRNYDKVCKKIIEDKVHKNNVEQVIETFTTFFELKEEDKNECYRDVYRLLNEIKFDNLSYIIRRKVKNDCKDIAHVITLAWNETYQNIVPKSFLQNLYVNEEERARNSFNNFREQENHQFVLEIDNKIVGFVNVGEADDKEYKDCGEICALYLLNDYKGKGYGKKLFETGIEELRQMGYKKVIVGCLDKNISNEFYKHMGGRFVKERIFQKLNLSENVYLFDNI